MYTEQHGDSILKDDHNFYYLMCEKETISPWLTLTASVVGSAFLYVLSPSVP